ncbi:ligand-binding sensor domain-containing protein [Paraflavitalea speifideaquila]|uniref:ligand-binding sensor domain-containing protein n=1 Tax=Paraflavitalea speifideaquila TaxID=3076558 RepID=UPI0028E7C6AC|nr:two-component regulator propeller domain-containing protein [Paraflavitalea speifideiaquila]
MRIRLLIWYILLLPGWAAAQEAAYSFRTININHGLSQNSVIDIATDDKGFLWFATQDGLNRYDGKEFAVFRKNFDDITTRAYSRLGKVIAGIDHDLWLITSGGKLERFNLYNDSSTPFRSLLNGMKLPAVSCFRQEKNGALWIGTERAGLFYQDTAAHTTHYTRANGWLNSDSIHFLFRCHNKNTGSLLPMALLH